MYDELWKGTEYYSVTARDEVSTISARLGSAVRGFPGGTIVYREVIRDFASSAKIQDPTHADDYNLPDADLFRATIVHEIGHMFGLDDTADHGKIMWMKDIKKAANGDTLTFSGLGLRKIATTFIPLGPNDDVE